MDLKIGEIQSCSLCLLVWSKFLISEVVAYFIMYNVALLREVIWTNEELFKPLLSNHAFIMVVTMIVINGHGMVIFRLFPSCRTQIIKYIHAGIHTVTLIGSIYAYCLINRSKSVMGLFQSTTQKFHISFGLMTAVLFIFQWLAGVFVYLYLYSNQKRRKLFASCHNFIGVCVLQISIVTSCLQIQEMSYKIIIFEEDYAENAMVLMVIYGIIINVIVLNPHLEWRLVGPL
ncbi:lysosomal membrane ascorbate-dependent ferrireductase CYB561A3-like [Eupeodes corollae]|uniref:lysosomal membrane ascorbate-dependent ferrireductase CYB561A3-like n=1 Tax=Eupeodes corollae TaxID=290404 RepID=UPI0024908E37|nr:lysosomal membrane ascorbate-dependent ferrireductase CYB561A3-like [Eupeodes corollae]XP_055914741.1 lysosomal membrane ascorbate-dependent ferrireductase CYB561A3-like [Eupeodes corollae]